MGTWTGLAAALLGIVLASDVALATGPSNGCAGATPVATKVVNVGGRPDYRYPYRDPYVATITSAVMNAHGLTPGIKRQVVHVPGLPGRNDLPSVEGRGQVSVALYRQSRPAPLLFIVSGVGSNPFFGLGTYLAGLVYRAGFHVVILPSPMTWNFALAASRSGAPGYTPDDARDLYEVMQRTLRVLRDRYDLEITGIHFLGASLGALEGAYVSALDADQRKVGIGQYLLVNPPLDLSYALGKLDEWDALGEKFGKERSDAIRARALAIIERVSDEEREDAVTIRRLAREFSRFTTQELQFLIAQYVRMSLPELILVTQVLHDQRVLTAAKEQIRERLREAKRFTLRDYREKIAVPLWTRAAPGPRHDPESLSRQGSLMTILGRLRGNPRVHILHNADDILTDRKSIAAVEAAMGDEMTVYPLGGHLGNLWYWQNRECILGLFRQSAELRVSSAR